MRKNKGLSIAVTMTMLAGWLGFIPPAVTKAENMPPNQTVLDFEDREDVEEVLTGKYEGCDFGNRGWNTGSTDGSIMLWTDTYTGDSQVNKIAIPYGKIFRGFKAEASEPAVVKVDAGSASNTFEITADKSEYTTDFTSAQMGVYITVDSPKGAGDVKFDDIILEDVDLTKLNVSEDKPASTSDPAQNPASNGNDGNDDTLWINNGGGVNKWWQVDLEGEYALSSFEITFEKEESPNAWKYKIEGSTDGENFELLCDRTDNTDGSRTQVGELDSEKKYRYVRVTITGLPMDSYWCAFGEFRVFTADVLTNVALNKSAEQSAGSNAAGLAIDGDVNTFSGNTDAFPYTWTVNLEDSYNVEAVEIEWEDLKDGDTDIAEDWKYTIESSEDGSTWTNIVDYSAQSPYTDPASSVVQKEDVDVQCNYLRVTILTPPANRPLAWAIIPEFRAYAQDTHVQEEPGQYIDLDQAFGQVVKASSTAEGYAPENTTDRNAETTWKPNDSGDSCYLEVNLGQKYNLSSNTVTFADGTAVNAYKFLVSNDGSTWTEVSSVSEEDSGGTVTCDTAASNVRFEFTDPSNDLEVSEIAFDGLDALEKTGNKIMVLAPHQDDEMLMAGGIIKRAVDAGDDVKVLLATNGDYNGQSSGEGRILETVNALNKLGLSKDNIVFLGYADTGGLGGTQTYWDSFLYKLYTSDDDTVWAGNWGHESTFGNPEVKNDFHYEKTGEHAEYTRANFIGDLQTAISEYMPTDIYVPSRYDMHFDHAYLDLFAIEAIQNIQETSTDYNPILHESIIHSCAGDSNWPEVNTDIKGMLSHQMPEGLETLTMFNWNERENVNVPYSMRQTPFEYNLKDQALRLYTSQYYDYIGSFAKVNEIFWTRDFSSFAHGAAVTASSETAATDRKIDQSAVKAVDGVRDGYAVGLSYGHERYPHAEWKTNGEKEGAWINLNFGTNRQISKVVLYDRPNANDQITGGKLVFSDNSEVEVGELPNDGRPLEIEVSKQSSSVKFVVTSVSETTTDTGLAEIEVY